MSYLLERKKLMAKYIIDTQTGTMVSAEYCYIVDDSDISDDLNPMSDSELSELAERVGKSLQKMGLDTGWGDNAYRYTVSYSPLSLRDEANMLIEGGVFTEEDEEHSALRWAGENADIDELAEISEGIMAWDSIWQDFRTNFIPELVTYYKNRKDK
jgi:hypothetical protein